MSVNRAWMRRATIFTAALVLLSPDAMGLAAIAVLLYESVSVASEEIAVRKRS